MLQKYRRLVRGHQEQNLGDFVPLCDAIPELAGEPSKSVAAQHQDRSNEQQAHDT
jgi:hypothetical protein